MHYCHNAFTIPSPHLSQRLSAIGEEVPLAMETSGHGAFKDNNYCDDGTFTALLVACFVAENNSKGIIEDFEDAGFEEEVRMKTHETNAKQRPNLKRTRRRFAPHRSSPLLTAPRSFAWPSKRHTLK